MKRLIIITLLIAITATAYAATTQYYAFPDANKMYDTDRILVFQNASGSRNLTGSKLKSQVLTFANMSGATTIKGSLNTTGQITATLGTAGGTAVQGIKIEKDWSASNGANLIADLTSHGDTARFILKHSQGSKSSPTTTNSGNQMGVFGVRGFDGSAYSAVTVGLIAVNAEETFTSTAQGTRLEFFTTAIGATTPTAKMRIKNTGNVLIGSGSETAGLERLQVTGAAYVSTTIKQGVYTVATLPTGTAGMRAFVSDANATTFASIVAAGGANFVPVYHDGTNWRIG